MSADPEPPRARWSYTLDRITVTTAVALPALGFFLMVRTDDPFWGFITFMPVFAMIGIAAVLRIIARRQPWRTMRLVLLVMNIFALAGIVALGTGYRFLFRYLFDWGV